MYVYTTNVHVVSYIFRPSRYVRPENDPASEATDSGMDFSSALLCSFPFQLFHPSIHLSVPELSCSRSLPPSFASRVVVIPGSPVAVQPFGSLPWDGLAQKKERDFGVASGICCFEEDVRRSWLVVHECRIR